MAIFVILRVLQAHLCLRTLNCSTHFYISLQIQSEELDDAKFASLSASVCPPRFTSARAITSALIHHFTESIHSAARAQSGVCKAFERQDKSRPPLDRSPDQITNLAGGRCTALHGHISIKTFMKD